MQGRAGQGQGRAGAGQAQGREQGQGQGQGQGRGRARAGQGEGRGRGRPGHCSVFFSLYLFSFSHMISYHKLGTFFYQTLSNFMISYDKRVAVLPNSFSVFFFFFSLGVGLLSRGWPLC